MQLCGPQYGCWVCVTHQPSIPCTPCMPPRAAVHAVPLAERVPQLRGCLYEAMLRALVRHVALPQHFTSWEEEGEVDQDAFDRLRCGCPCTGAALLLAFCGLVGRQHGGRAAGRLGCVGRGPPPCILHACRAVAPAARLGKPPLSPGRSGICPRAFNSALCREQMLPESLETAYGLLRCGYLGFAWHLLQSATSWQQAEAALYLFK